VNRYSATGRSEPWPVYLSLPRADISIRGHSRRVCGAPDDLLRQKEVDDSDAAARSLSRSPRSPGDGSVRPWLWIGARANGGRSQAGRMAQVVAVGEAKPAPTPWSTERAGPVRLSLARRGSPGGPGRAPHVCAQESRPMLTTRTISPRTPVIWRIDHVPTDCFLTHPARRLR
jgi:hypothetical protein